MSAGADDDSGGASAGVRDVDAHSPLGLGAFLKLCGAAQTGGHAKMLIQSGDVRVNGEVETRRGRRLANADLVSVAGVTYRLRLPQ